MFTRSRFIIVILCCCIVIATIGLFGYSLYSSQAQTLRDQKATRARLEQELAQLQNAPTTTPTPVPQPSTSPASVPLPQSVILDIPSYRQKYSASCEVASAHAAMAYFGVLVSESTMVKEIGIDPTPRTTDSDGVIHWGNPQKQYVGGYNPKQVYVDGYGVYNQPVYSVLARHGFKASISKTDWKVAELLSYVRKGYPAIVWTTNDFQKHTIHTLQAPDGSQHRFVDKEHALVIRGVDRSNVYVMDVGRTNALYAVSIASFTNGFSNFENMAIVVIPD